MKHLKVILLAALVFAPFVTRAEEAPQKTTFEPGAWLVLGGFQNSGAFDGRELPRFVLPLADATVDQKQEGWLVRQSRLRFGVTVPTDNYLAGALLKGLIEVDFMGGTPTAGTAGTAGYTSTASAATVDPTIIRMRHVYFSASWKQMNNLTLTVGQTWGPAMTLNFAQSLAHLAVPRFGGAGFLYRRAPQVRLSGDVPAGPVTLALSGAVVSPGDLASAASGSAGNESAVPNFEGRVAAKVGAQGVVKGAELGFGIHYGSERYLTSAASVKDVTASSQLYALDGKLDFGIVNLIGGIWQGQNLDVYNSIAGQAAATAGTDVPGRLGVLFDTTNPNDPKAYEIKSQGAYLQLGVVPAKAITLVAGAGFENPDDKTLHLPAATTPGTGYILRNTQYSAAVIWAVTSKWKVSFEATRFLTQYQATAAASDILTGNQFQVGSLLSI